MARTKRERPPDPDRLIRRTAGDLHTEDGRFEVSSTGGAGRWYVTDTERHDQLGLALVLGPFGTLDEARVAVVGQRATPAGDDQPLPEPSADQVPSPRRRGRRDAAAREPGPEPEPRRGPRPEPEPEPEPGPPPPPRPPIRVSRDRWRPRRDVRDEVVAVVRRVDDAWLSGDPDAMIPDLHASVVFVPPEPGKRLEGPAATVDSYRAFLAGAVLTAVSEQELSVDVAGATAVVRYRLELEWEADGERHQDTAHVLCVLTREDDRWLVAWRTTLSG